MRRITAGSPLPFSTKVRLIPARITTSIGAARPAWTILCALSPAHWTRATRTDTFPSQSKESLAGGKAMRRRDFLAGLGVTAASPFAARGQEPERPRRVGVLIFSAENDPVTAIRTTALRDGLQKLGWTEGVNLQIDYRFGAADPDR